MDQKSTSQQLFNLAEEVYKSFYHVIFLEVCKSYQIVPDGLYVEKEPCIGNPSKRFLDAWKNQLEITRSSLRDVLLEEYVEKYFKLLLLLITYSLADNIYSVFLVFLLHFDLI